METTPSADLPLKKLDQESCWDDPQAKVSTTGDETEGKTVCSLLTEFGQGTTMHGMGRATSDLPRWKRAIWWLLILAGATIAIYNVTLTITEYTTFPVSTVVSLVNAKTLNFPAVTICNLNPVRLSKVPELWETMKNIQESGRTRTEQKEELALLLKGFSQDKLLAVSHPIGTMLKRCTFNFKPCSADSFVSESNSKFGSCHTFNKAYLDDEKTWKTSRPGPDHGLTLVLNIGQEDYMPLSETAGLKVLVHSQSAMAFPEDEGLVISPGMETNLGIVKVKVERAKPPYGRCMKPMGQENVKLNMFAEEFNVQYSEKACRMTCYQLNVFKACRCCDGLLPCPSKALAKQAGVTLAEDSWIPDCNVTNTETAACVYELNIQSANDQLGCSRTCHPGCEDILFKESLSVASWPSEVHVETLRGEAKKTIGERNMSAWDEFENSTGADANNEDEELNEDQEQSLLDSFVSKNFLKLRIYYKDLSYERIQTLPAYDWNKLLSDLGGQLGLWMGFSLLTAAEFIQLLWDLTTFLLCRFGTKPSS